MQRKIIRAVGVLMIMVIPFYAVNAQSVAYQSQVWSPDLGNGYYKNPIIFADYSDPDVIRVGDDYYMIASSFDAVPGIPVLHSKDLVNWSILTHALVKQPPFDIFDKNQHGNGVWAPAIRYHNKEFYIYYPDPDYGIYMIKTKNILEPWSDPVLVEAGKGLIDPCPLWDDDGQAYLVHGFAGSRAEIKSVIVAQKMNADGTKIIEDGKIIIDGHESDPTLEGPKIYKRNGFYYVFAPAGGVSTGWQLVMRSKNIYGPYERKVVMAQGKSDINGPHQGAWVTTQSGQDWFIHFRDMDAYGRVTYLEPMVWKNDWPVIGEDKDGDGNGDPVSRWIKPNVGKQYPKINPEESDEFNTGKLGLQWQWQANPKPYWYFMNTALGALRLYSYRNPDSSIAAKTLWYTPNVLLQKFPAEEFMVTTKMKFTPNSNIQGEKAGLVIMGMSYANIGIRHKKDGNYLTYTICENAANNQPESEKDLLKLTSPEIYLRVKVSKGAKCQFAYSLDGQTYLNGSEVFQAEVGKWIGAKVGLFCTRDVKTNDAGFVDVDYFRVEPVLK